MRRNVARRRHRCATTVSHGLLLLGLALLALLASDAGAQRRPECHPSYVNVCIPPPPPDLDCADLDVCDVEVVGADPHHLDRDHDGIACECPD